MMRFANPWVLFFLVLIPGVVFLAERFKDRNQSSFRFPYHGLVSGIKPALKVRLSERLIYMRGVMLFLIILAVARPQAILEETKIYVEGIDIVLAVDASGSMRAMDFEIAGKMVDRLEVVKDVVEEFIGKRPNDRIGLVAFSGMAYTICPITLDHDWLESNLERVQIGMIEDGTAIGSAIAASLNRIKETEAKDKIIILLTDGRNNAGRIPPKAAAEAAKALNVRIYTIGAGKKGLAPYPVKNMFGETVLKPIEIEIDEKLLKDIADMTGGKYYRATDTESLKKIYDEIDKLEKTPMEESGYNIYKELFPIFLVPALGILLIEVILSNSFLRRLP